MPFILNETKLKTMFKLEFLRLCYLVYNYNYKTDNIALKKKAECLVNTNLVTQYLRFWWANRMGNASRITRKVSEV